MRENIVPHEAKNKPVNAPETGNDSQFDTPETVDDLLIDYVIPTRATDTATDEIYEEIDMATAMEPAKLTKEDFQVWNIVDRKKRLAAETGQIVPGINDGPILRQSPLTEKDYNTLLIPATFKGDGSEFTAEEILKRKQQLIEEHGLNVPGVEPIKASPRTATPAPRIVNATDFTPEAIAKAKAEYFTTHPGEFPVDEIVAVDEVLAKTGSVITATPAPRIVNATDFTPEAIAKAKAEYFTTHPGEFPIDEIVAVDEVLRRNGQITTSAFNKATLQDQFENNERRRLGLRDPHDSRVLASTENFFDSTQTDTAVAGYQRINTLREAPAAPSQPGKKVTVLVRKPTSDAFVRTGNLINPNATPLDPRYFHKDPLAELPIPLGNEPVKPKPSIFKILKNKFLDRFWYR